MSKDTWIVTKADAGTRLDKWLADGERLQSRRRAFDALSRGRVFIKGAPEVVLDLCSSAQQSGQRGAADESFRREVEAAVSEMGGHALRLAPAGRGRSGRLGPG